ncbi:homeobox protein 2-like [Homarus americanus]|uniref:homeobox protein 2-like n=1 Tax=Homarus americanus TaxID=6706 RepID=UPI001C4614C0|nr:homeobox protein 2-like [Homarus americanus]
MPLVPRRPRIPPKPTRHQPPKDFQYPPDSGSIQDIISYMNNKERQDGRVRPPPGLTIGSQDHIVGPNPFGNTNIKGTGNRDFRNTPQSNFNSGKTHFITAVNDFSDDGNNFNSGGNHFIESYGGGGGDGTVMSGGGGLDGFNNGGGNNFNGGNNNHNDNRFNGGNSFNNGGNNYNNGGNFNSGGNSYSNGGNFNNGDNSNNGGNSYNNGGNFNSGGNSYSDGDNSYNNGGNSFSNGGNFNSGGNSYSNGGNFNNDGNSYSDGDNSYNNGGNSFSNGGFNLYNNGESSSIPPVKNTYDPGSSRSKAFNIMLDVYPMDDSSRTSNNKRPFQTSLHFPNYKSNNEYNSNNNNNDGYNHGGRFTPEDEANKHEIILHLNLFSKMPTINRRQGISSSEAIASGRTGAVSLEIPLTGQLSPLDIYKAVMNKARTHKPQAQVQVIPGKEKEDTTDTHGEVEIELFDVEEGPMLLQAIEQGLRELNVNLPPHQRFVFDDEVTSVIDLHNAVNGGSNSSSPGRRRPPASPPYEYSDTNDYEYYDYYDYDDYDDVGYGEAEPGQTATDSPSTTPTSDENFPEQLPTPCWHKTDEDNTN